MILHPSIRDSATAYFRDHEIRWWGDGDGPTASPISSQVACVNHLEPARLDADVALAVLRSVLPDASAAAEVEDGGFAAYEWIGQQNYLGEQGTTRGVYRTSLDALLVAEVEDKRTLVLIEWKYTESYQSGRSLAKSPKGTDRVAIYRPLLEQPDCPIESPDGNLEALFFDPIEQLMRQALLGWQMTEAGESGASDWLHLHVVPAGNTALRDSNPSPALPGTNLVEAWRSVLKAPERYRMLTPSALLAGVPASGPWAEWRRWLADRYGTAVDPDQDGN